MLTEQPTPAVERTDPSVGDVIAAALRHDAEMEERLAQSFTGPAVPLDQLGSVAPGTVVAQRQRERATGLKLPGDLLVPPWWPTRTPPVLLPITTEPVTVHVAVDQLRTLDGTELEHLGLDVQVQLDDGAGPRRALLELVDEHGSAVGTWLQRAVQQEVDSALRNAVGMNRGTELRRQSLAQVLTDRWLPGRFVDDLLIRVGFAVREERWAGSPQRPQSEGGTGLDDDGPDTEPIPVVQPVHLQPDVPQVRRLGSGSRWHRTVTAESALNLVYLPAVLSVGVGWLFFVPYWLPELSSLPGLKFVLTQFAPLASKELSSAGQPLVAQQSGQSGLPAAILLLVSLALAPLARSRWWLARLALWPLTYLAVIVAVVSVIGVVAREHLGHELLGVLLLILWAAAAVLTSWRSLWVEVDTLPRRPTKVLWLLGAYALVNVAPVAVSRWLFAPELRDAALSVQENDLTLRWAALLTPGTALLYLCGLAVGAVAWAVYLLLPPRRGRRRRTPAMVLALSLLALIVLVPPATQAAQRRAATIRQDSPRAATTLNCGQWAVQPPAGVARTLVVSGLSCRRLTTFRGYQELGNRQLSTSLSPVSVTDLGGRRIPGRLVAGQYGGMLVAAGTDRLDHRATMVLGLRLDDAVEVWRYRCPDQQVLSLRFAGTGADDSTAGRTTLAGEGAAVVLQCDERVRRLDPATGRRLPRS